MSRIGKAPIGIPEGVQVEMNGQTVIVTGPKGRQEFTASDEVSLSMLNGVVSVVPRGASKRTRQHWGMNRTMIANCIEGAKNGFKRELHITGVGYRAQMRNNVLNLTLGLSHDVNIEPPEGITISTPSNTRIIVEGADKQQVGQVAAEIRRWRRPEPFKGKGIRFANEFVFRKVGKKK